MANLKDLRDRINSVQSTKKITSAMKLVAGARLKKAQTEAESSRSYVNDGSELIILTKYNPAEKPLVLTQFFPIPKLNPLRG